jgi:hypothetical protein
MKMHGETVKFEIEKNSFRQTFGVTRYVDKNTDHFGQASGLQYSNIIGSQSGYLNVTR